MIVSEMTEQIVLGIIQGVAEWLPVSSEGLIVLAKTHLFSNQSQIIASIKIALFLHFGTFLAALVYFHKDVRRLLKAVLRFRDQSNETQKLFVFLFITTLLSGFVGLGLLSLIEGIIVGYSVEQIHHTAKLITLLIGILLLVTAYLELKAKKSGHKNIEDLRLLDGLVLGVVQGCAALPGLSRSGLTVSVLLLRKFDKTYALKLSFLMSLPIVLGGNIILHLSSWSWSPIAFVGLFFSFIFGLATIHLLLKIAEKINFGYFVLFFGVIVIFSTII